jgi:signal peptidase II
VTNVQGWARAAATVVAVVAADQVTKLLADGRIARGDSINVFFGLDLTNTRNRGVAFGFLEGRGGVVGVLIAVALLALVVWFALNAARAWLWLPVGLLLGGAIGNLIDRAREGAVIDFIDPVAWPAFNLADMCIVFGVLALLYVVEGPAHGEA